MKGNRNVIKLFDLEGIKLNIKSFKKPNLINQIAYRYFRKSKARRSFEYANILIDRNIKTPQPVAYFENSNLLGITDSYYICEHLDYDLTYRELITTPDYKNHEEILRKFTRFTWEMHEKGIYFKDHSPGNTLIVENKNTYEFYLVDLNRMSFIELDFEARMKSFARLTPKKEMIKIMSHEYAKLSGENFEKAFELMWYFTENFRKKYERKKRLKQKYLGKK
ncbi:MAG: lipopolysaccharide kinase InaA family protein [Gelidibacter sp.]